jgi:hypothetical protein
MSTHADILRLVLAEATQEGRDDVLTALAAAFVAAYDDECDDDPRPPCPRCERGVLQREVCTGPRKCSRCFAFCDDDDGWLSEESDAHAYYREQYGAQAATREVTCPTWAPLHRPLLRAVAEHERQTDDAVIAYYRAHGAQGAA